MNEPIAPPRWWDLFLEPQLLPYEEPSEDDTEETPEPGHT